jgi:mRNA-degrading endonuclease toxin of MazEF toxin-antitoxin module
MLAHPAVPSDTVVIPRRDYPFLVELEPAELGERSWVHCETISTVPIAWLADKLGALSPEALRALDQALKVSLGLR